MFEKKISLTRRQLLLGKIADEYDELWGIDEYGFFTPTLLTHVHGLFFKAYRLHLEGKSFSLTSAGKCIPGANHNTRTKYLERAREEGYFEFTPNLVDKRKILVKVTPKLVEFVEQRIERQLRTMSEIITAQE